MKLLALEKEVPGFTAEHFQPYLEAEAEKAWELYRAGVIREMYFRADVSEAVLILECSDLQQAQEVLASLPLVQQGLITFEVIPLRPYSGFSRLFARGRN